MARPRGGDWWREVVAAWVVMVVVPNCTNKGFVAVKMGIGCKVRAHVRFLPETDEKFIRKPSIFFNVTDYFFPARIESDFFRPFFLFSRTDCFSRIAYNQIHFFLPFILFLRTTEKPL